MARFVDYLSVFWDPRAIFMANEPEGVLMCRSSILAVLADSRPIHGLLLTVLADSGPFRTRLRTILGTRRDYHDKRYLGCIYVPVIYACSFGRLWPFSWTITHR